VFMRPARVFMRRAPIDLLTSSAKKKDAAMKWPSTIASLQLTTRRFTDRAIKVLSVAGRQAATCGVSSVTPEHVLLALALVERGPGRVALERLGLDLHRESETIAKMLIKEPNGGGQDSVPLSAEVERLVDEAAVQARGLGHNYVGTEHLALALLSVSSGGAGAFLRERGISPESLQAAVLAVLSS
jgi:ATP-dependent Clp protease ATP-binding subunit ClpC